MITGRGKKKNKVSLKYDRFSRIYDFIEAPVERRLFSSLRKRAVALARGKVLEVGVGTGKNLPYYPVNVNLTGIDFSKKMLEKAIRRKTELSLNEVKLFEMDVEKMDFKDESFDTVVSTFVFCTVPHPVKGLREVYRVLKRGGTAIFLEHMKSNIFLLNIPLYIMHVFIKPLIGTSMLRETQKNIEKVGFKIKEVQNVYFDIIRLIIAYK
jgi:ubiquinone/menaquinone biosynthesis C-methylase UbiE